MLGRELKRALDEGARARKAAELEERIATVAARLDDTVPNLKAPADYAEAQGELEIIKKVDSVDMSIFFSKCFLERHDCSLHVSA